MSNRSRKTEKQRWMLIWNVFLECRVLKVNRQQTGAHVMVWDPHQEWISCSLSGGLPSTILARRWVLLHKALQWCIVAREVLLHGYCLLVIVHWHWQSLHILLVLSLHSVLSAAWQILLWNHTYTFQKVFQGKWCRPWREQDLWNSKANYKHVHLQNWLKKSADITATQSRTAFNFSFMKHSSRSVLQDKWTGHHEFCFLTDTTSFSKCDMQYLPEGHADELWSQIQNPIHIKTDKECCHTLDCNGRHPFAICSRRAIMDFGLYSVTPWNLHWFFSHANKI